MMDELKFKSALMGGGVFGVVAALPYVGMLNSICCALYIGGGALAVYFYIRARGNLPEEPYGDGAVVGLLAGLIGGVVTTVVGAIFVALGLVPYLSDAADGLAQVEQMGGELPGWMRAMVAREGVSVVALGIQLVMNVIFYAIFATIGGLVGVAIFQRKGANPY